MTERLLLAALLLATVALAWTHHGSPAADLQRRHKPLVAFLDISAPREPGGGRPASARYLAVYSWDRRALDLVRVGTKSEDISDALERQEPAYAAAAELPARFGAPDSPEAVKAWILSWPRDARFWLSLRRSLRALRASVAPPLPRYDGFLLALEAYRLGRDSIRLAWLPPPPEDRRLLGLLLQPDSGRAEAPAALADRATPVTVQLLNASSEEGVALLATKVLRLRKADVVEYGNAPAPSESTQVLDRVGDAGAAEEVRRALGCGPDVEIVTRIEPRRHAAVTVTLGKDYRRCRALAGETAAR